MGRNPRGKGEEFLKADDFLEGQISDENLGHGQHMHGHCHGAATVGGGPIPFTLVLCQPGQVLPTCPGHVCCGPDLGVAGCCWIILATTNCTTTLPGGATCCWRFLATTDCTDTRGNAGCCWQILATTDCTHAGGSDQT